MTHPTRYLQSLATSAGARVCTRAWAGILLALVVAGCNDTVIDPFQNESQYFTVYGYLDEQRTDQAIRVIPVTRRNATILDPSDPNASIDAVVTTTELVSGQVTRWRHNLELLTDGTYAHIFRTSFNIRAGRSYRLDIVRNDGKMTTAETHVPNFSSRRVSVGERRMDSEGFVVQDVVLPSVPSPWDIKVIYRFPFPVYLPYGRVGEPERPEGTESGENTPADWRFTIQIDRDIDRLAQILETDPGSVAWSSMGVQIQLLDDKWTPPLDIFDPEILSQPGALSNVDNGYGFFGSVALLQDIWPSER
jgi:hypothetical protein